MLELEWRSLSPCRLQFTNILHLNVDSGQGSESVRPSVRQSVSRANRDHCSER